MQTAANVDSGKLTYRDFLKFPDDGQRHELIDGVHCVTPSPFVPHQMVLGNLYFHLRLYLDVHPTGRLFLSPSDVVLSTCDIVVPDLFFVSEARRHIVQEANVQGAPDLVVEIRSRSTARRDEGVKLALYDRSGVGEYWVVDPRAEVVRVYRRGMRDLACVAELASDTNACLTSPLLRGFSLPIGQVFAR